MKQAATTILLIAVLCPAALAVPVPINGDFEASGRDDAPGWAIDGPWRFSGNLPHNRSRRAAGIGGDSLAGDALTSLSGVVVRPGQSVRFTGYYRGDAGLQVRLELIGIDGAVHAQAGAVQMVEASDWAQFAHDFAIPAAVESTQMLYARVVLEVTQDGAEGTYDDLRFPDGETWPPVRAAGPADDEDMVPTKYPIPPPPANALPNPAMRGAAVPHGWNSFGPADATSWQPGSLSAAGSDETVGWSADIAQIDVSVPQRLGFMADVAPSGEQAGRHPYAVLLRCDTRGSKVYAHTVIPLRAGRQEVEVLVDAVEKLPARGGAQFMLVCPAGCTDTVTLSAPALTADPHVPSVTAARRDFGIFDDGSKTSLYVRVPNALDQVTEMVTHLKIQDIHGTALSYEKRNMACGARAVALFPVSAKLKRAGLYHLLMRVQTSDGSRDLVHGLFPFVVAPSDAAGPKNPAVCATISGTDAAEIEALATAGVGWVRADLDYPPGGQARRLEALARDMGTAAATARYRGIGYAVRIKLPGGPLPAADEFDAFASTVTRRMGSNAEAYILDAPAESLLPDAGARALAELGRIVSRHAGGSAIVLVPQGVAERGFPSGGGQRPEQFDDIEGTSIDSPGDMNREPTDAGHDCAQPGLQPSEQPVAPATAPASPPLPPTPEPATPAPVAQTPVATGEYAGAYEVLFAGSGGISGTWLAPAEVGGQAPEPATLQACLRGLAEGHALVSWDAQGPTRVLDDEGIANTSWLALWNMAGLLRGRQFSAALDGPEGISAFRFSGSVGDVVVIWSDGPRRSVSLSGSLAGSTQTDIYGGEDPLQAAAGHARLAVTWEPTYITLPTAGALTIAEAP